MGTVSRVMCNRARDVVRWTEVHLVPLLAHHIPGIKNILADHLSRPDQVHLTEWFLLPRVFKAVCAVFSRPYLDLFATRADVKLPLYMCPVPDLMA